MKNSFVNLLFILWAIIILPNSGVRVITDYVVGTEAVVGYTHWGIISSTIPYYAIKIKYYTGYIQYIRYELGERWACEEDYQYLQWGLR